MRRVLSYGPDPDGEVRESNVETAPATADHTRHDLIPCIPVDSRTACVACRHNRCRVHQKRRHGVAEILRSVALPNPIASASTPEGRPFTQLPCYSAAVMWIVVQPFGALDITSRHRFLLHTHLGRRHLGHEERAWQAASDPIVWGMDATRPRNCWGLCSPPVRAVSRWRTKQGRCAAKTFYRYFYRLLCSHRRISATMCCFRREIVHEKRRHRHFLSSRVQFRPRTDLPAPESSTPTHLVMQRISFTAARRPRSA